MSIFNDKDLIKLLTLVGVDDQNKYDYIRRYAQVTPADLSALNAKPGTPISAAQTIPAEYRLAKKLLIDREREIGTKTSPKKSPIGSEKGGAPPGLKPENLIDVGNLLNWAVQNKVTFNNKKFVWGPNEEDKAPPSALLFKPMLDTRERMEDDRSPKTLVVKVLKPEFIELLTYLRDSDEARENKVFEVMIGKIISRANEWLGKDKLGARPEKAATPAVDANIALDGFDSNTIDFNKPYDGVKGNPEFKFQKIKLFGRNLASKGALTQWLQGMNFKPKDGNVHPAIEPGKDVCGIIHVLYLRAKYLSSYAGEDANYQKAANYYLAKIQELGKQYEDGYGNACSVVSPGAAGGPKPGTVPAGEGKEGAGKGKGAGEGAGAGGAGVAVSAGTMQLVNQFINLLPLRYEEINLNRISDFLNFVIKNSEKLFDDRYGPEMVRTAAAAQPWIQDIKNMFFAPVGTILTSTAIQNLVNTLKPPRGNYIKPVLDNIENILNAVVQIISIFADVYADTSSGTPIIKEADSIAKIRGQVSLYKSNLATKNNWETQLGNVVTKKAY